jgi:hypothetical protein
MAKNAVKKKKKRGSGIVSAAMFFSVLFAVLFGIGFLYVGGALLPSLAALVVDRSQGKFQFKTILCLNISGMLPIIGEMVTATSSDTIAMLVASPRAWIYAYGAAAVGWVVVWMVPQAVKSSLYFISQNNKQSLEEEAKALIEEWGEEVTR